MFQAIPRDPELNAETLGERREVISRSARGRFPPLDSPRPRPYFQVELPSHKLLPHNDLETASRVALPSPMGYISKLGPQALLVCIRNGFSATDASGV